MRAHVRMDADSGIVHGLETTRTRMHGEISAQADRGYVNAAREAAFSGPGSFRGVVRKAPKDSTLDPVEEDGNRTIAMVHASVEDPFRAPSRGGI